MKRYFEQLIEFVTNRVFLLFLGVLILFSIITTRLFSLQVIHGEEFQSQLETSIMQTLSIPASRGNIYDRYGRPLAINQVAFSVKIDDSIKINLDNRNKIITDLVLSYSESDLTITDDIPISKTKPYFFSFSDEKQTLEWKKEIGLEKDQLDYNEAQVLEYLEEKFEIPSNIPETQKRKIMSLNLNSNDKNLMILYLISTLDKNNEIIYDDLPISAEAPYVFMFDGNETKKENWMASVAMDKKQYSYSAPETLSYLADLFQIPENLSAEMKRKMIAVRYSLYLVRFKKYQPITVALNISEKTVTDIEEKNEIFPGVTIDTASSRYYPEGEYFSHILGYIRKIDDDEYKQYSQYGYTTSDIVGKSGIEKLYELDLNGEDGEMLVEVDVSGRRINTIQTKEPVSGKDIFLTLDLNLQKSAYNYLEQEITDTLIKKLTAPALNDSPITLKEVFSSLVKCNNISVSKLCSATGGEQAAVFNAIRQEDPSFSVSDEDYEQKGTQLIINLISSGKISTKQIILVMIEQGRLSGDEAYVARIKSGGLSSLGVLLEKLKNGEIKPSDTDLDPCSGSVVLTDVNNGEVLALVTYPSYDNNRFVNNFDSEYYAELLSDPSTPLVNRPLRQKKAPGSTFKMISAVAGLESGTITPSTIIQDLGRFTKAGTPYARCWIYSSGGAHGNLNVSGALEVSCNYFFYETAYRMGNQQNGTTAQSIDTLNYYMDAFGLNDYTGIEIGESAPNMASPEYKEEIIKWQNPSASESQTRWTDGDTIRAAIGQSVNNYAPAHINKYISTLANGGTKYKMHLVNKLINPDGSLNTQIEPIVENELNLSDSTISAIFNGMLKVTQGSRGTLRNVFKDFPINVAAKSGTAQEGLSRSSHTWFVGFAPYESPQIAVTVMIPFGEASTSPAAVVGRNIIGEYMGLNYNSESTYMQNTLSK